MTDSQKRWWDFPAAFLLLVAVWTAVIRLSATEWTQFLNYIHLVVLVGMGLGLLLGQSNFPQGRVVWFSIIYSVTFVPWQLMRTMEDQILWSERLLSLFGRLGASIGLFLANQPIQDPILFLFSMALLFWGISLYAGYQFTRKGDPWIPVLLAGLILLIVDFYNPVLAHRGRYTGVFVFTVLLLAGRIYFLMNQKKWGARGIAVDSETGFGLGKSIVISGLLVVVFAWNIPVFVDVFTPGTMARDKASRSWNWLRDRVENAVVGLQGNTVKVSDFYGDNLALGSTTAIGNETVFNVEASTNRFPGMRFYWRGNTYDYYENGNWNNRFAIRKSVDPDDWPLELADLDGKKRVNFTFKMGASLQVLYIPSTPVNVSRPVQYIAQDSGNGELDVVALYAEQAVRSGEVYKASSMVSTPSIMELKNAGENYPEWITNRYLQLPSNFSDKVLELTEAIIVDAETPYDKANAITEYLRNEITYADTIDTPPDNRDPIEWFLLDYKKGFCNYYATSEVLMLRAAGIPARMVAGFAQGEYLQESKEYRVRRKDSHAWPEVYFPGVGWVEFEPTVSQPEIELQEGAARNLPSGGDLGRIRDQNRLGGEFEEDPFDTSVPDGGETTLPEEIDFWQKIPDWVFIVAGLSVLSALFWLVVRKTQPLIFLKAPVLLERAIIDKGFNPPNWLFYFARWGELSSIERMIYQIRWMLRLLGVKLEKGLTAQDQMNMLCEVLPEAGEDAERLLTAFHLAIFSNHTADFKSARYALINLWNIVWRARLRGWLGGV